MGERLMGGEGLRGEPMREEPLREEPLREPGFRLEGGGLARLSSLEGERGVFEASRAFPVGSTLVGTHVASGQRCELKVRGCRKNDAGRFVVQGRFVNLSRVERERLAALA